MLKPIYLNICISILFKCLIFYVVLMVINNDFRALQISNIRNGQDLFYYLFLLLFFPLVDIMVFSLPLLFIFRIRKALIFTLAILLLLSVEYFIYAYATSQKIINRDAFIKIAISFISLLVVFYRPVRLLLSTNEGSNQSIL